MIGLCGAQRVGKSTLANAFAMKHNIPFLQTGVSAVFRASGMDPKIEYPIEDRIALQMVILSELEKQYLGAAKVSKLFIADRTPIDMAAYMMADIRRETLVGKPAIAALVNDYVSRCLKSSNRWFSTIVLVQPGIPQSEKEGSAAFCPAFMEHMNTLCLGLLLDVRLGCQYFRIGRGVIDLDARVQSTGQAVASALVAHNDRMEIGQSVGAITIQ